MSAKEQEKIWVRLPDGMRDRLAEVARENKRSVNAEVVARLEASFEENRISSDAVERILERIVARIESKYAEEPEE